MASKLTFALSVFLVAIFHFFATFMLAFITGTTESGNRPLILLNKVLTFPLSLFDSVGGPDVSPYLAWGGWFATSLAWGATICFAVRALVSK